MKKMLLCSALVLTSCASFADPSNFSITNATWCVITDQDKVSYGRPLTVYAFTMENNQLKYSGVSVSPGMSAPIPLSPNPYTNLPGAFLGTSSSDTFPHVTLNFPRQPAGGSWIVGQVVDSGSTNCTVSHPCVMFVPGMYWDQCLAMNVLAKKK